MLCLVGRSRMLVARMRVPVLASLCHSGPRVHGPTDSLLSTAPIAAAVGRARCMRRGMLIDDCRV